MGTPCLLTPSACILQSARSRKSVNYSESNIEISGGKDLSHQIEDQCDDEEPAGHVSSLKRDLGKDTANLLQERQHEAGDFSPEKELSGDYLEAGGGFCINEDEKDYLATGGGFCIEEDEEVKSPDKCKESVTTNDCETDDPLQDSSFANKTDVEVVKDKHNPQSDENQLPGGMINNPSDAIGSDVASNNYNAGASEAETISQSSMSSMKVLSAMPTLRRKRKKS